MRGFLAVLAFLVLCPNIKAQSVFTYDWKKEAVIGTVALGVFASPFFIDNPPPQLTEALSMNNINGFDRFFMFSYNETLDKISDYGVYGMLILPALSIIGNFNAHTLLTYGIMYTEAFLLTYGTKDLLKNCINRFRPYMYEGGIPNGLESDFHNSFPSGSTSLAFLAATFLTTTFSMEHPESKWKLPIIIGSYTLAVSVATMRITSGSHFMTDVLVGAAIGSFYGWVIPFLHQRQHNNNLAINFTGNGLLVSLKI